jgi:hypothetical protein
MRSYYYFFSFIILSIIVVLVYSFTTWRKGVPVELFVRALKEENNGDFEQALAGYEIALYEFEKTKSNNSMRNKIIEKLKVLHLVIDYQNSIHFIR